MNALQFTSISKQALGTKNSNQVVGFFFLFFSLLAMLASFTLSIETLFKARNPTTSLGCDLSAEVSCGKVAESWQAELLHIGAYAVPNAFLGMIFEAVFITIAVLIIANVKLPKWFMIASQAGNLGALIFAVWLFWQSSFVILTLCPWCLLLFVSTTFQFIFQLQYNILAGKLPFKKNLQKKLVKFYDNKLDVIVNIFILIVLIFVIAIDILTLPERRLVLI
jgi:uncharacterized membrane protein